MTTILHIEVVGGDPAAVLNRIPVALVAAANHIKGKVNVYPGPPHHPLRWASLRQKRYVLARGNLPYKRGGIGSQRLSASWSIIGESRQATLISRATYAQYVLGPDHQQPFHKDTGWKNVSDVLEQEAENVLNVVKSVLEK